MIGPKLVDTNGEARTRLSSPAILLAAILFPVWYVGLGLLLERYQTQIPYFVTEYIVTCSGGFVRRGALGQCFLSLGDLLHLSPIDLIRLVRVAIALAFASILGFQCFKNRRALGFWGVCLILSNPLISLFLWFALGSVDLLFVLITVLHIWLAKTSGPAYFARAWFLFSTLGLFLSLSHEAFLFLCLPVNAAVSWQMFPSNRKSRVCLVYAVPIVVCMACFAFKGTPSQVRAITQAWTSRGIPLVHPNAVDLLTATIGGEVRYALQLMKPVPLAMWGISTVLCVLPLVCLGRRLLTVSENPAAFRRKLWLYFGIPILCTLPLYPVGNDWHRWLTLPFLTGTLCLLTQGLDYQENGDNVNPAALYAATVLVGLIVTPMSLYYPPSAILWGPLLQTIREGYHTVTGSVRL